MLKKAAFVAVLMCALVARAQDVPSDNPPAPGKLPAPSVADVAWKSLTDGRKSVGEKANRARGTQIQDALDVAAKARDFYTKYPDHYWSAEAKNIEIFSLIEAYYLGDPGSHGQLERAVADLRKQKGASDKFRVRGLAAYSFAAAVQAAHSEAERHANVERAARGLLSEFPSQPQGYEALWTVCQAADSQKSIALARELVAAKEAPAEIRADANRLIARESLLGKSLKELAPEYLAVLAKMRPSEPVLVYSWSINSPGSVAFGQMVQARRFNAIALCIDDDLTAAKIAAGNAGIGGQMLFKASASDAWSAALHLAEAGRVLIVDSEGIIRDVRGGDRFEEKVTKFGFKTPVLSRP